jgi:cytochrome P450
MSSSLLVWSLSFVVVGSAALVLFCVVNKRKGHRGLPGFVEYPVLGAALELPVSELPWKFVDMVREAKFANTAFSVLGETVLLSCHAEDAELILQSGFQHFEKGSDFQEVYAELLGKGIFTTDGQAWQENRKAASHLFATGKLKRFQNEVFHRDARLLADVLEAKARDNVEFDLQPLLYALTFDSFCDLAFGVSFDSLQDVAKTNTKPDFLRAFDDLTLKAGNRFYRPFWKLEKLLNVGDEALIKRDAAIVHSVIDQLVSRVDTLSAADVESRDDLLSMFVVYCRENRQSPATEAELRDITCNMILAGRDTSASTLTSLFRLLHHHPAARDKLEAEIDRLTASLDEAEPLTYERLKDFAFLDACVMESLRLFPPVAADLKKCIADEVKLPSGLVAKKGDLVYWYTMAIQRNPLYWNDGESFKPERWIEKSDVALRMPESKQPFVFPAFNGGPRLCLGKRMALLEIKNAVVTILRRKLRFVMSDKDDDLFSWKCWTSSAVISLKQGLHGRMVRRN